MPWDLECYSKKSLCAYDCCGWCYCWKTFWWVDWCWGHKSSKWLHNQEHYKFCFEPWWIFQDISMFLDKGNVGHPRVTREGTTDVKRAKKHALIQEYELFRMQQGEIIADVQKRFTHIVNHLIGLGKVFDKKELNIKILKCLDRSWQPKAIAILESWGSMN